MVEWHARLSFSLYVWHVSHNPGKWSTWGGCPGIHLQGIQTQQHAESGIRSGAVPLASDLGGHVDAYRESWWHGCVQSTPHTGGNHTPYSKAQPDAPHSHHNWFVTAKRQIRITLCFGKHIAMHIIERTWGKYKPLSLCWRFVAQMSSGLCYLLFGVSPRAPKGQSFSSAPRFLLDL